VSLSGAAVRPVGSLRRADTIAAFFAGTAMIALAYYVLLLRETTFHRAAAADASRPSTASSWQRWRSPRASSSGSM
jgi:hypothetical protein